MPLTDLICPPVLPADMMCVTLPGGVVLCAQAGLDTGDAMTILRSFFAQINTGLAPIQPFYNLLEGFLAIKEVVESIPKAILSVPPDPTKLAQPLEKLLDVADKLAALLPHIAIPRMIGQVLRLIIMVMVAMRNEMMILKRQLGRIVASALRAQNPNNAHLQAAVDCAQGTFEVTLANLNTSMGPLNQLVGLMNALLDLTPIPGDYRIPTFETLGTDPDVAIEALDEAIEVLETVARFIPA